MPGFEALGRLALGQLPTVSFAVTTGPLVFSTFSQPLVVTTTKVYLHPPVNFEVENPKSFNPPTTGPLVFTKFSEPSFSKVRQQSTAGFIAPPTGVTLGGDFADFDLVQSKKPQQQGFTSFTFVPPVQTTVFTQFSQPVSVKSKQSEPTTTLFQQPAVVTVVTGGVFADWEFSQTKKQNQSWSSFSSPPAALTPVFSVFSVPLPKKPQQIDSSFVGNRGPAQTPPWFVFSDFGAPRKANYNQQDFLDTPTFLVTTNSVFTRFDQPFTKRILQQDQSFVNFPVVTVVTQPYVFSDFGQPQYRKVLQDVPVNFTINPPTVVVVTNNFSGFSDFGMPKKVAFLQSDFLDSPVPPAIQNYVFTPFSQPQAGRIVREGFTNAPFTVVDQRYIFSLFSQPTSKQVLQVDQSFVNLPVIVQFVQPYLFSSFEQPSFKRPPQFDASVQYQIFPPAPVISVFQFTGFSDFGTGQRLSVRDLGSVFYDIFVPPAEIIILSSGKQLFDKVLKPNVVKLDSTHIAEIVHDKRSNELTVKFKNNDHVYHYNNVDSKKVKGLVRAKSSGSYFHNNIKGQFPTTKLR